MRGFPGDSLLADVVVENLLPRCCEVVIVIVKALTDSNAIRYELYLMYKANFVAVRVLFHSSLVYFYNAPLHGYNLTLSYHSIYGIYYKT